MTTTESTEFVIPTAEQRRQALKALQAPVNTAVEAIAGFADGYERVITALEKRVAKLEASLQQWRDALAGRDDIITEHCETIAALKHEAARLQELLDAAITERDALSRENEELQKLLETRDAALREVQAAPRISPTPWDSWGSPPPLASASATAVADMVAGRRARPERERPDEGPGVTVSTRGSVRAARVVEGQPLAAGQVPINAEAIAEKRRIAARANGEPSQPAAEPDAPVATRSRGAVRGAIHRLSGADAPGKSS